MTKTNDLARDRRRWINSTVYQILRDVAELPDRTSPLDQPEMMLVTRDELEKIVRGALG